MQLGRPDVNLPRARCGRYRRRHLAGTDVRAATPRPRSSGLLRVILSTTRPVDQLAGGHRTRVIPALSDDAIQRRQDLVGHFVLKAFGDDAQPEHVELGIHRCALVSMRRRARSGPVRRTRDQGTPSRFDGHVGA